MTQSATPEPLPRYEVDPDKLRASDGDRAAVVEQLRQAHADGRLDLVEFDERTRSAYASRTYADLAGLTADLPAAPLTPYVPRQPAVKKPPAETAPRRNAGGLAWRIVGSAWLFASLVNLLIWAIICVATASLIYPWWIWVAGPWGAVLLAGWLSGRGRRDY